MPTIDEPTRTRTPDVTSAKSPRRQIMTGDYQRNDAGAGTVVGLGQQRGALSPDEVDEQIRRFFEQNQP